MKTPSSPPAPDPTLILPRLGLGCGTFGREIGEHEAFALMDYAVANGITLFDTAEVYGGGQARAHRRERHGIDDIREVSGEMHSSEKIVGRWLSSRRARDRITLVTKVSRNFRVAPVRAALEASLARLQTEYVDLYLYHSPDPTVSPEEAGAALDAVVRSGLARHGGASNYSAAQLATAREVDRQLGHAGFAAVELCTNLLRIDHAALNYAHDAGLAVLGYSPLAAGFLSGKYGRNRTVPSGTRFDVIPDHQNRYFHEWCFDRVDRLQDLARETGIAGVQLALAWACQHPLVSTTLVGARHLGHLDNALAATRLRLDTDWITRMNAWPSST
jgi:aryl-alcohol dehydrogenase-like predicted oxidoreductase